jgi:hypothetical protein
VRAARHSRVRGARAAPAQLHARGREDDRVTIELLYFDGCPNHDELVPHLRELLAKAGIDAAIELRHVETVEDAERERFLGSPTVRVDGRDVDPGAEGRDDYGMKCRLYATADGLRGTPPDAWILSAVASV